MNRLRLPSFLSCVVVAFLGPFVQFTSAAGINTNNPALPSLEGFYTYNTLGQPYFASYLGPGVTVELYIDLQPLGPVSTNYTFHPNEYDDFSMSASGQISVNGSAGQPTTASGTATEVEFGKGLTDVTGTFNTELIAMSLSGTSTFGPYMVRESPTLASTGQSSVTSLGGNQYHIDSFFDVFTELSLDGGNSWIPSIPSTRVILTNTPEPATATLVGLGLIGMLGVARRRR